MRTKILTPWCLLLALAVLTAGCLRDRYTYSRIRAEYGQRLHEAESAPVGAGDPVVLPDPDTPLSLERAVEIGLANNPDMDMALARIRQSEAMIDQARAAFWPSLSLYYEYTRGDAPSAYLFKVIDQRNLPPQVDFNDPGLFENNEVGLTARTNFFNGGRDYLRVRMAETGLAMGALDRQSIRNGLVMSVIHAYYDALAARDFIRISEESVETVKAQLRIMKVRYEAGGVLKSDVLSLEVRLAQAREDLIRARNAYSLAIASLGNLMGLDPDTGLALVEGSRVSPALPGGYEEGLPMALARRPELEKARLAVVQSRMGVDAARGEYLPRLDAQAKLYADDEGLQFESDRANWTAGMVMNWDFFTGFSTRAAAAKAEAALGELLAADRKAVLSVKLDLKSAYLRLAEAEARLEVSRASVAQAEESLRLVKTQYEGGSATVTRYLDAETARNRAETRAVAAFYDREKAQAAVARAVGYWVDRGDASSELSGGVEHGGD